MKPRSIPELQASLQEITRRNLRHAEELQVLNDETLNQRPAEKAWSALEAIEHLRRYGEIYVPELSKYVVTPRNSPGPRDLAPIFTSTWLGNKLAAGMKPGPKTRKVSTVPSKNPLGSQLGRDVLEQFMAQQRQTLDLLERAEHIDWNGKVKTSLPLLKLRFGDALRTYVYHNWRHVEQARRAAQTFTPAAR